MACYRIDFDPVDTWFFRGTRPHSAAGAASLPSDFPPSPSTLSGAVRTRLGQALGVDWQCIREDDTGQITQGSGIDVAGMDAAEIVGSSLNTGELVFGHPWIRFNGERLFSVPSMYLRDPQHNLVQLVPGDVVHCDLGRVRLPQMARHEPGAKALEHHWLTETGLSACLRGEMPAAKHVIDHAQLFCRESRLGIARDNERNTVHSGMLFQTQHLRLNEGVGLSVTVDIPEAAAQELLTSIRCQPLQRLGGEGRMAALSMTPAYERSPYPEPPQAQTEDNALVLTLISDARFESADAAPPLPGFEPANEQGVDCWRGTINGIELTLDTAVCAKAVRHGGWDIRHNRPRTVESYVPAGSCFFVRVSNQDMAAACQALHGIQIGGRTDHGFGQLVCARVSH